MRRFRIFGSFLILVMGMLVFPNLLQAEESVSANTQREPQGVTNVMAGGYIDTGGPTTLRALARHYPGTNLGFGGFFLFNEAEFAEMRGGPHLYLKSGTATNWDIGIEAGVQVFKGQLVPRFGVSCTMLHPTGGFVAVVEHDFAPQGLGFWYMWKIVGPPISFGGPYGIRPLLGYRRFSGGGPGVEVAVFPPGVPPILIGARWIPLNEASIFGTASPDTDRFQIDLGIIF